MWQNPLQCCRVISLQLIKINEKKKILFLGQQSIVETWNKTLIYFFHSTSFNICGWIKQSTSLNFMFPLWKWEDWPRTSDGIQDPFQLSGFYNSRYVPKSYLAELYHSFSNYFLILCACVHAMLYQLCPTICSHYSRVCLCLQPINIHAKHLLIFFSALQIYWESLDLFLIWWGLYDTGISIQYSVMTYKGKESKKRVDICRSDLLFYTPEN